MKPNLFLALILTVFISSVNAQFRIGVQATGLKLPASAGNYGTSYGPGIDFGFSPSEGNVEYFFNASYFLAAKSPGAYTFYSNDGNQQQTVSITDKTSLIGLVLGTRYFFLDREDNDFNIYATGNANLVLATTKTDYTVPAGYVDDGNLSGSGNSSQLMIGLGLGFEYRLNDAGSIFAEAQYRFPATDYNSRTGYSTDVQIPGHPWFSVGYKFSLGGGSGY